MRPNNAIKGLTVAADSMSRIADNAPRASSASVRLVQDRNFVSTSASVAGRSG